MAFSVISPTVVGPAEDWVQKAFAQPEPGETTVVLPAEAIAVIRLDEARREITPEAIEQLAPYVPAEGRTHGPWKLLVHKGKIPTPQAVEAEYRRFVRRAGRQAIGRGTRNPRGRQALVAQWVAHYHAEHGHGPTWREVTSAFGWTRLDANMAISRLRRADWLAYTEQPRSLRPGPRYSAKTRKSENAKRDTKPQTEQ
jgi:hypothetical protein